MTSVRLRAPWIERGERHPKNTILEVSADKAEMLVSQNRAVMCDDPAPAVVAEPTEEALIDAALTEVEGPQDEQAASYKPGSMTKGKRG